MLTVWSSVAEGFPTVRLWVKFIQKVSEESLSRERKNWTLQSIYEELSSIKTLRIISLQLNTILIDGIILKFSNQAGSDIHCRIEESFKTFFNPLTFVPPVTARDEPWPFFLFWRHHFWPKLASSILNFCRRKRSFQWCPDQNDRPNGALDMHKNAQKVEWKT